MEPKFDNKIDRSVVSITTFQEAEADDIEYWMSRTPAERIAGIEHLRRWIHGDAEIDAGLQRILEAVELGAD